jgi:hypothetical protein
MNDIFDSNAGALIRKPGTAFVSSPCRIQSAVMGQNFKGNHFKLVKNTDQDMKDFVVEFFTQSSSENGESAFARDVVFRDTGMCSITTAPVLIPKQLKEFSHVLMPIDIAKQVEQEDTWGIITRRAIRGITVSDQRSDE